VLGECDVKLEVPAELLTNSKIDNVEGSLVGQPAAELDFEELTNHSVVVRKACSQLQ